MNGAAMAGPATKRYGLLFFGAALVLTAALGRLAPTLGIVLAWVLSITALAFVAYGFDKQAARSRWLRVPERILLALSFAGGTLGALAGMRLFRHKTVKASFRLKLWLVTAAQIAALAAYYAWFRPSFLA